MTTHRPLRRHRLHRPAGRGDAWSSAALRPVLAARGREALEQMAADLGGLETARGRRVRARPACARWSSAATCWSPRSARSRAGARAAAAAASSVGAHYIDSTGEPAFIRQVFEVYGPAAEQVDSAMLTAFGYDWVPGNLAGATALERAGEAATRVDIGYFTTGKAEADERRHDGVHRRGRRGSELRVSRRARPDRARREAGARASSSDRRSATRSPSAARSTSPCPRSPRSCAR